MSRGGISHVRVAAPAKLNLVLRVLAREATGYHGIESLFTKLTLHDVVTVHTDTAGQSLAVRGPQLPADGLGPEQENLAWRAAVAYQAATDGPTGFAIEIDKQIPVGGGLGGGSADAAAVLRALNALSPAPLSPEQLLALAAPLGADVPFLVSDAVLAWSWSRGDRLLRLPPLPARPVELVTFREGVPTGFAYAAIANQRAGQPPVGATLLDLTDFASWAALTHRVANDFERVVPALHAGVARHLPQLREIAARLSAPGEPVISLMSGSGATCALIHPEAVSDEVARARLVFDEDGVSRLATRTAEGIVEPEPIL